ncbi:MAG: hypothetical protein GXO50_06040 [Chlorobi bacterium]|nr:hypothetical protein [Chlorobiota bacterium]
MILKRTTAVLFCVLFSCKLFSQVSVPLPREDKRFWQPLSFFGEFRTFSKFRQKEIHTGYLDDTQSSSQFSAGILICSQSYFWHPDFLLLDVETEYNPDIIKENYIVIPDRSETRTLKRLKLKTTFFNTKVISLNAYADLAETYGNRDNITDIKINSERKGAVMSFANKVLPVNFSLNKISMKEEETETGKTLNTDRLNFTGKISKSFYSNDNHGLSYSHNEYDYDYTDTEKTRIFSDYITLNDNFNFDSEKKYNFRSRISYQKQRGSVRFSQFIADEYLTLKLPGNLTFIANYDFVDSDNENLTSKKHNIKTDLHHKLFSSLNSGIFYEYRNFSHNSYGEYSNIFGTDIHYTKKIPLKGRLNISYNYRRQNFRTQNEPLNIRIFDENHVLTDGEITLLNRPYVDINSVTVTDATGTFVYRKDFDYMLVERGAYVEILRFPGGQIQNNQAISVDYTVRLPETYGYDLNFNGYASDINLWNGLIQIYFNVALQNYKNMFNADALVLNRFTQYKYGIRTDVKFASCGIEFDNYDSNIMPYNSVRYYLNLQKNINKKLIISLNGSILDYYFTDNDINNIYSDISAKVAYMITEYLRLNLETSYRNQKGTGIDLELLFAKTEVVIRLRKLYFSAGFERYNRNFLGDINNYNGIFFKMIRKFRT